MSRKGLAPGLLGGIVSGMCRGTRRLIAALRVVGTSGTSRLPRFGFLTSAPVKTQRLRLNIPGKSLSALIILGTLLCTMVSEAMRTLECLAL